jgi:hypothetical protein
MARESAPVRIARVIDDRASDDLGATTGTHWRLVSDAVMGGVSRGELTAGTRDGRACLHLRGRVSLENNGGFLQAALDLSADGALDVSAYAGIALDVHGRGERYNLHLRTDDLAHPWQAYRAGFDALPRWQTVVLPFHAFAAHRTDAPFDPRRLKRIGIVAIGRAFDADLCFSRLGFFA